MGKFDFVGTAIGAMGAETRFHKVAIRLGHPILFATLPGHYQTTQSEGKPGGVTPPFSPFVESLATISSSEIAFFALPGNPLASAVCLRFLVIPYLRALHGIPVKETSTPVILLSSQWESPVSFKKPVHLQAFWHGRRFLESGKVTNSVGRGSNKIRPLLEANCWVGIPPGCPAVTDGETVETFEMYPPSLGL
jgi:molybdopterin molybdotransferase